MAEKQSIVSKQQLAYEYIKTGIQRGTFAPNQRLVIDTLARELSISKVPVREAVRRLEAEGLVEFSANSGAVVSRADPALWFQLMELLAVLEGYATASAAASITRLDIKRLREINAAMRKALDAHDYTGWTDGNRRFHETINSRSGNPALIEQMINLQARTKSISRFIFPHTDAAILHTLGPGGGRSALEAHEWLVAAFERNEKPEAIEQHARDHILRLARRTRELLENPPAEAATHRSAAKH
jgi:DNA-binding GntR family transcriptional regulator